MGLPPCLPKEGKRILLEFWSIGKCNAQNSFCLNAFTQFQYQFFKKKEMSPFREIHWSHTLPRMNKSRKNLVLKMGHMEALIPITLFTNHVTVDKSLNLSELHFYLKLRNRVTR